MMTVTKRVINEKLYLTVLCCLACENNIPTTNDAAAMALHYAAELELPNARVLCSHSYGLRLPSCIVSYDGKTGREVLKLECGKNMCHPYENAVE